MFCTKCGQKLNEFGVCTNENCPSKIIYTSNEPIYSEPRNQYSHPNNPYSYTSTEESNDLILFVGEKNTEYYMEKYTRYQQNPGFSSWNWPAFFISFYWLLYRKMYGYAAAFFGIQVLITLATDLVAPFLNLTLSILCGIFANQFYIKFSLNKIRTIKVAIPGMSEQDINRRLSFNGGTNLVAPLVCLGIVVVLLLILVFILILATSSFRSGMWYY